VLFTPRPLGPLIDVAELAGGDLADAIERGAVPYEVAAALGRGLDPRAPAILVLEDVHAADEATLDVLRLLAKRLASLPALLIVTYRDVGLDRWHPLRVVLGEVASTSRIDRLRLPRCPARRSRLSRRRMKPRSMSSTSRPKATRSSSPRHW